MKQFIWLSSILILLAGCSAGSKMVVEDDSATEVPVRNTHLLNEDFNPNSLKESETLVNPKQRMDVQNQELEVVRPAQEEVIPDEIIGYRIQLKQTQNPDEAHQVQNDAILSLDSEVYSIFDSPYYKVRAGDFAIRSDAEEFLQEVINKGYKGAWIVQTKIKNPALNPELHSPPE